MSLDFLNCGCPEYVIAEVVIAGVHPAAIHDFVILNAG
jgi:hypothetical protein